MKKELEVSTQLAPVPVVLISCGDMENSNICTISWTGIVSSKPAMLYISIRPSRYSHEIISKTLEFVVNIPDSNLLEQARFCGIKTGKDVDKFAELNLSKKKFKNVNAPGINECPINLECKVKEIKSLRFSRYVYI